MSYFTTASKMTQSLLNLMDSPLAVAALILWLLLAVLAIRVCRRWAKERNAVSVIYQNHPAIPVRQYKLTDFEAESQPTAKPKSLAIDRPKPPLHHVRNVWDV